MLIAIFTRYGYLKNIRAGQQFVVYEYDKTDTTAGKIGRITTAEKISDFPLPTSSGSLLTAVCRKLEPGGTIKPCEREYPLTPCNL